MAQVKTKPFQVTRVPDSMESGSTTHDPNRECIYGYFGYVEVSYDSLLTASNHCEAARLTSFIYLDQDLS